MAIPRCFYNIIAYLLLALIQSWIHCYLSRSIQFFLATPDSSHLKQIFMNTFYQMFSSQNTLSSWILGNKYICKYHRRSLINFESLQIALSLRCWTQLYCLIQLSLTYMADLFCWWPHKFHLVQVQFYTLFQWFNI